MKSYACFTSRSFATELRYIRMPSVMDSKSGVVDKWLKHVGDQIIMSEDLCEITTNDFTIALDCKENGVLVELITKPGETIAAEQPIATYVLDREAYMSYLEGKRLDADLEVKMADVAEVHEKASETPDALALMRQIKHLVKSNALTDKDLTHTLQSLARKADPEIMSIFLASFDKDSYDNFDAEFFLDAAQSLVQEKKEEEISSKESHKE